VWRYKEAANLQPVSLVTKHPTGSHFEFFVDAHHEANTMPQICGTAGEVLA